MSLDQSAQPTEKPAESPPAVEPRRPWLRRADQCGVAMLVALGLLGTVVWWWTHGGFGGNLVEFERLQPQEAKFLVDVNEADWPELAQLPDIGETLARRIVESRKKDGPFKSHDEIRRVKGIGPRTLERIQPYLLPLGDRKEANGP
jgi:competence protein ComEA